MGLNSHLKQLKLTSLYGFSLLTRGVLSSCIPENCSTPMVMRVSGGATVVGKDLANETIVTPVKSSKTKRDWRRCVCFRRVRL